MLALVGPWVVYNAIRFDHPTISSQAGTTLWLRAFDQDKYPVPTDTEDARFAKSVYDQRLSQLTPAEREDTTDTYVSVFNAFLARGDSIYDANHALGSIAREAIHQYLGSYATGTVRNIAEYSTDNFDLGDAKAAYLADSHDVAFDHPPLHHNPHRVGARRHPRGGRLDRGGRPAGRASADRHGRAPIANRRAGDALGVACHRGCRIADQLRRSPVRGSDRAATVVARGGGAGVARNGAPGAPPAAICAVTLLYSFVGQVAGLRLRIRLLGLADFLT
jgi:hypothetical protein